MIEEKYEVGGNAYFNPFQGLRSVLTSSSALSLSRLARFQSLSGITECSHSFYGIARRYGSEVSIPFRDYGVFSPGNPGPQRGEPAGFNPFQGLRSVLTYSISPASGSKPGFQSLSGITECSHGGFAEWSEDIEAVSIPFRDYGVFSRSSGPYHFA